jgi:chromosome segregation ATPase
MFGRKPLLAEIEKRKRLFAKLAERKQALEQELAYERRNLFRLRQERDTLREHARCRAKRIDQEVSGWMNRLAAQATEHEIERTRFEKQMAGMKAHADDRLAIALACMSKLSRQKYRQAVAKILGPVPTGLDNEG